MAISSVISEVSIRSYRKPLPHVNGSLAGSLETQVQQDSLLIWLCEKIKKIVERIISQCFYMSYDPLTIELAKARTLELIQKKGAFFLSCKSKENKTIDALYIPSKSSQRTGNVIVYTLNTSYQDFHPRHYEHFLASGADVVLWNPTALNSKQYAGDLTSVLKTLGGEKKIVVRGYCAGVDPVIAAVEGMNNPNIFVILDRGHGNIFRLARSFAVFVNLPIINDVLAEKFDCCGERKIQNIRGKILHLAPSPREDVLMHCGNGRNVTYELHDQHRKVHKTSCYFIQLENSGHWTAHNFSVINKIKKFLSVNGIISNPYPLVSEKDFPGGKSPTFFQRNVLPFLVKSWC